jgi:hypothetical protein
LLVVIPVLIQPDHFRMPRLSSIIFLCLLGASPTAGLKTGEMKPHDNQAARIAEVQNQELTSEETTHLAKASVAVDRLQADSSTVIRHIAETMKHRGKATEAAGHRAALDFATVLKELADGSSSVDKLPPDLGPAVKLLANAFAMEKAGKVEEISTSEIEQAFGKVSKDAKGIMENLASSVAARRLPSEVASLLEEHAKDANARPIEEREKMNAALSRLPATSATALKELTSAALPRVSPSSTAGQVLETLGELLDVERDGKKQDGANMHMKHDGGSMHMMHMMHMH